MPPLPQELASGRGQQRRPPGLSPLNTCPGLPQSPSPTRKLPDQHVTPG